MVSSLINGHLEINYPVSLCLVVFLVILLPLIFFSFNFISVSNSMISMLSKSVYCQNIVCAVKML